MPTPSINRWRLIDGKNELERRSLRTRFDTRATPQLLRTTFDIDEAVAGLPPPFTLEVETAPIVDPSPPNRVAVDRRRQRYVRCAGVLEDVREYFLHDPEHVQRRVCIEPAERRQGGSLPMH